MAVVFWIFYNGSQVLHRLLIMFSYAGSTDLDAVSYTHLDVYKRQVQESLESLARNRTTFVIAHRLSTIRNARRILVLTEDGIAEEGTHKELLERNGVYAHLYQLQF